MRRTWGLRGWLKATNKDDVQEPNAILKEYAESLGIPPATGEDIEEESLSPRADPLPERKQSGSPKEPEEPDPMPVLPDDQVTTVDDPARPHDDHWCSVREASILPKPDGRCPACGAQINT